MNKILYPAQLKYLSQFKDQGDPLIREMEKYAEEHKVPILSWEAAAFLEILISIVNPKRVLEIGTAIAYSSIRIARNLKKKGVVHTIEKSKDNIVLAKGYISKSAVEEKIIILEGNAFEIIPKLEKKYDFIFLDADKNEYSRLFELSVPIMKKGGVLFIDNLLWGGNTAADKVPPKQLASTEFIRKFNKEFMSDPRLKSTIITVGDGLGVGVKI